MCAGTVYEKKNDAFFGRPDIIKRAVENFWLQVIPQSSEDAQTRILASLLVIFVLWLIKRMIQRLLRQHVTDLVRFHQWRKSVNYLHAFIVLIILGHIWLRGIKELGTFLGLLSAGLAIALHDTIANLAGWIFIVTRKPFVLGDRIEIGGTAGDVIDIRPFQFSVIEVGGRIDAEQSTGRIINVPNAKVMRDNLANFSTGFDYIWHEIPVLITFESNWKKAKELLLGIVNEKVEHLSADAEAQVRTAAMRYLIFFSKMTPTVYTSVRDSGVLLTIRYIVKPRTKRGSEQEIWEAILDSFAEHPDIDLAYPTTRFYRLDEGNEK